jgi:hypothetical protein
MIQVVLGTVEIKGGSLHRKIELFDFVAPAVLSLLATAAFGGHVPSRGIPVLCTVIIHCGDAWKEPR